MSPPRCQAPAVLCLVRHTSTAHACRPSGRSLRCDVLWALVETVLWFPRRCGRGLCVHTAGSVHRTDRSRRGSCPEGRVSLATSSYACRRRPSSTRYGLRAMCAVTNLPTAPPLKPGRPAADLSLAPGLSSARGPPAYATAARSTAPAGTVPSRSYRQSAMTSLRASATMPTRRGPGPPRPNRRRYHCVRSLSGCHFTQTHAVSTATRRTAASPARLIPWSRATVPLWYAWR